MIWTQLLVAYIHAQLYTCIHQIKYTVNSAEITTISQWL